MTAPKKNGTGTRPKAGKYDNEKPEAKFVRLANKRVPRILKAMKGIKNLAKGSQYKYTDKQAEKIVAALKNAVTDVENAFIENSGPDSTFTV